MAVTVKASENAPARIGQGERDAQFRRTACAAHPREEAVVEAQRVVRRRDRVVGQRRVVCPPVGRKYGISGRLAAVEGAAVRIGIASRANTDTLDDGATTSGGLCAGASAAAAAVVDLVSQSLTGRWMAGCPSPPKRCWRSAPTHWRLIPCWSRTQASAGRPSRCR